MKNQINAIWNFLKFHTISFILLATIRFGIFGDRILLLFFFIYLIVLIPIQMRLVLRSNQKIIPHLVLFAVMIVVNAILTYVELLMNVGSNTLVY